MFFSVSVLLLALVERFGVSRMRDFFKTRMYVLTCKTWHLSPSQALLMTSTSMSSLFNLFFCLSIGLLFTRIFLTEVFCDPWASFSSKYHKSQTLRTRKLNFWENVHPPHMLHVKSNVSCGTCIFFFFLSFFHFFFFFWQSGEAYRWRSFIYGAYPV